MTYSNGQTNTLFGNKKLNINNKERMKSIRTIFPILLAAVFFSGAVIAQDAPPPQQQQQQEWPKSFTTDDGTVVKIYQPQPEGFADNVLKSRWAISVLQPGKQDPVFGTF